MAILVPKANATPVHLQPTRDYSSCTHKADSNSKHPRGNDCTIGNRSGALESLETRRDMLGSSSTFGVRLDRMDNVAHHRKVREPDSGGPAASTADHRSVYRSIELLDGWKGPIAINQNLFLFADAMLMVSGGLASVGVC